MTCKKEILEHIGTRKVLCIDFYAFDWDTGDVKKYMLPAEYTEKMYTAFINSLDFEYENEDGDIVDGINIEGYIWYTDDSWSERWQDGYYMKWVHMEKPSIPSFLLEKVDNEEEYITWCNERAKPFHKTEES